MATSKATKSTSVVASAEALDEMSRTVKKTAPKKEVQLSTVSVCRCLKCGIAGRKPDDMFYKSLGSSLYRANQGYVPICKSCMNDIYEDALKYFDNVDLAMQLCCHYLDWPYVDTLARKARDMRPTAPIAEYAKRIGVPRYKSQTYKDTIYRSALVESRSKQESRAVIERAWDQETLQNMGYIKNIFGYDPFDDDSLTSSDRKFLFNTMAGYCPDSTIGSDSHKLQSILNIVKLQLQAYKIGEQINQELVKQPINVKAVNEYTLIQKNLHQSINTMAKENGISASGNGGAKPANTLTERMKLLKEEGFEAIEVNMFNVEQSEMFQKIADISMNSIIKELHFEDNDYSEILSEQLSQIGTLTKERDAAVEELRVLRNKKIQREYELEEHEKTKNK